MSLIDCPRCLGRYVDPSPVAALTPRPCPYCTGNTSTPATPDPEGYEKALAAAKTIGPPPPEVTFHESAGGIAVMLGDEPAGWMSKAQFEELMRQLRESDGRPPRLEEGMTLEVVDLTAELESRSRRKP